jgi:DNA polymerase III gamma/tau subunit
MRKHANHSKSWILYGPQGSGKTLNARAIADHLNLLCISDDWDGHEKTFMPFGTLHITNCLPEWAEHRRRILDIGNAVRLLGGA